MRASVINVITCASRLRAARASADAAQVRDLGSITLESDSCSEDSYHGELDDLLGKRYVAWKV